MILKHSGARRPLVEDQIPGLSWSYVESAKQETFAITLEAEATPTGKTRYYRIEFPVDEAQKIVEYIAQRLTREPDPLTYCSDLRKSASRALRDLADRLKYGD